MNIKTKKEALKAFKEGKIAKWELAPILENIEFEKNCSEVAKLCFKHCGE